MAKKHTQQNESKGPWSLYLAGHAVISASILIGGWISHHQCAHPGATQCYRLFWLGLLIGAFICLVGAVPFPDPNRKWAQALIVPMTALCICVIGRIVLAMAPGIRIGTIK